MNTFSGLSIVLTPNDKVQLNLKQGEQAKGTISVFNQNEQKIIIKLRSNAGKKIRIKPSMFALDSKHTISLEVSLAENTVNELIQTYQETKALTSYRLQFNVAGISDLLYDGISSAEDTAQKELITRQWNNTPKGDIQQVVMDVSFIYNSVPSSMMEERKSEESMNSLISSDVLLSPEYKHLKTQYEAICILVKRCQDVVRKQQDEKECLAKKLKETEDSLNSVKEVREMESRVSKNMTTGIKPSTITGISVFAIIVSFVIGFTLGQLASHFMK